MGVGEYRRQLCVWGGRKRFPEGSDHVRGAVCLGGKEKTYHIGMLIKQLRAVLLQKKTRPWEHGHGSAFVGARERKRRGCDG